MQLAFDLDYTDPNTQQLVPWAAADRELLKRIYRAPWKYVDTETTGLNPASKEINFSGKDLRRGVRADLRVRVVTVLFPSKLPLTHGVEVVSFDLDKLDAQNVENVAIAAHSKVVFAHNAGFDSYWLRTLSRKAKADKVVDSMLLARICFPEQPFVMAQLALDEEADPELSSVAYAMFQQERSGWSLEDLAVGRLKKRISKGSQGPRNWAEPFLSQVHYDYACSDAKTGWELCLSLLGGQPGDDLLDLYMVERARNPQLRMVEPQVSDIVVMREKGMPWSAEKAAQYVEEKKIQARQMVERLIELEPQLASFKNELADFSAGISSKLKDAIGKAFASRGLELQMTDKTGAFKVGEKDLRKVKAASTGETKELFDVWVGINRAKKAAGMATEVSGFAQRSPDKRIHSNIGHGPVTGRLSSSEPNCQQFPRDQGFRDCVTAREGYNIAAVDFSALDMRVGAALAIRAQMQITEVYEGKRSAAVDVLRCIDRVYSGAIGPDTAAYERQRAENAFTAGKLAPDQVDELTSDARKQYWQRYRALQRQKLLAHFQHCLAVVRRKAAEAGTSTWGSLRDAFDVPGMDIHTWTALGMLGQDPKALFSGLSNEEVAKLLKIKKSELGDKRHTGKVGNLSLLYAMKELGLQEAAAKSYNIHWTLEEAAKVRSDWLATYVEIDLWHCWTELNPAATVRVPDAARGGRISNKTVFKSYTLGGRLIYAFGLNAALSYEDQSTGADILGRVMETLRSDYPDVFDCTVNQVHDELVYEFPKEKSEEYTAIVARVMNDCAEYFLGPYGVKAECSPAVGDVWLKD